MKDSGPIKGIDHLEFYVGNSRQAAAFYSRCFGFTNTAYQGLETGERNVTSYVMQQGEIQFVLSSGLKPEHPICQSVLQHGDTIAVIALAVSDVVQTYDRAIAGGAIGATPPTTQADQHGVFHYAAIHAFGDTIIKFIDRRNYPDHFAPGFVRRALPSIHPIGLTHIDHIVGNVEQGAMEQWIDFFVKTMGFDVRMSFDHRAISTDYSALMSKVLEHGNKTIININEPAIGQRTSQIQEFLDYHHGPGIQHIGLATNNIFHTVSQLKQAGIEFLPMPQTYYSNLEAWVKAMDLPIDQLAEFGILIDRDRDGYLMQLFTKPIGNRPTLFFEIIERHGSRGFGAGNFKSLFIALEREQALRGNL